MTTATLFIQVNNYYNKRYEQFNAAIFFMVNVPYQMNE